MRDSQEFQAELDVLRMKEIAHQFKFAGSVGDQVPVSLYLETVYLDGHLGLADGAGLGQAAPLLPAALPVQRPAARGHQAGRARRAVGEVQELLAASSPGHKGRTLQRLLVRPASLRQYSCKINISPTISLHYQLPGWPSSRDCTYNSMKLFTTCKSALSLPVVPSTDLCYSLRMRAGRKNSLKALTMNIAVL